MTQISFLGGVLRLLAYPASWFKNPPRVVVTVDAVLIQRKNVLLIESSDGSLRLPGDFVGSDRKLSDIALDSLMDQTGIGFDGEPYERAELETWFVGFDIKDAPDRWPQSRAISHTFLFELPSALKTPTLTGNAVWREISTLSPDELVGDHFAIIQSTALKQSEAA